MSRTKKLAIRSLFVSIALVLHIAESMIPLPVLTPGAKIGLANIITMIAVVLMGYKEAFGILIARIMIGSIFGGGVSGFLYSFSGGMLSLVMMTLLIIFAKDRVSMIGISVTGAFFHSLGQVVVAALMLQNVRILSYLPVLLLTSIGAGIFVGYVSKALIPYLKPHISKAYV